jgi:aspartyl protease family protein
MHKTLLGMIAFGIVIGLAWPTKEASSTNAQATSVQNAEVTSASNPFGSDAPPETHLPRQPNGHFYADAEVNGHIIRFVVDTGASIVALTEEDARRAGLSFDPATFDVVGQGAAGEVRGAPITIDSISIEGKKVRDVRGAIIQGGTVSLLGQSYLNALGSVHMSGDTMTLR